METKTYRSTNDTQYTFPVKVKGSVRWISFAGDQNDFTTSNKDIQEAIENCKLFKSGELEIINTKRDDDILQEYQSPKIYSDIISVNDAVEILVSSHGISKRKLSSKDAIFSIAKEMGVSFPNLSQD